MENLFVSKVRVSVSDRWEYYHKSQSLRQKELRIIEHKRTYTNANQPGIKQ